MDFASHKGIKHLLALHLCVRGMVCGFGNLVFQELLVGRMQEGLGAGLGPEAHMSEGKTV